MIGMQKEMIFCMTNGKKREYMEIVGLGDNRNLPDSDCVWLVQRLRGKL